MKLPVDVNDTAELVSRCDVCKQPFRVVMNEHKQLVDPKDMKRPVNLGKGQYVHASCQKED